MSAQPQDHVERSEPEESSLDSDVMSRADIGTNSPSIVLSLSVDNCSESSSNLSESRKIRILNVIRTLRNLVYETASVSVCVPKRDRESVFLEPDLDKWVCIDFDPDTEKYSYTPISNSQSVAQKMATMSSGLITYQKTHELKVPQSCAVRDRFPWGMSAHQGVRFQACGIDVHKSEQCCPAIVGMQSSVPTKKIMRQAFGVDLSVVATTDAEYEVPKVVRECSKVIESKGLSTKGLYYVCGYAADVMDIREKYNKGAEVDLSLYTDVKIFTGVLKQFLRELPQPVISHDAYRQIMKATVAVSTMESSGDVDYTVLSNALMLLPKAHYLLLKYLGEHLHRVVDHSAENMMTAHNLAAIMSPTLTRAPDGNTTIFKDTHLQQYFVEYVITKHEQLFS